MRRPRGRRPRPSSHRPPARNPTPLPPLRFPASLSLSLTLTRNVGSKSNRDVGNGKRNEVTSPEAETC